MIPQEIQTKLPKGWVCRHTNGKDEIVNVELKEGFEYKKTGELNPFAVLDDERLWGSRYQSDDSRAVQELIEQIQLSLQDDKTTVPDPAGSAEQKNEIVPQDQLYPILPDNLTEEILKKHPGTISVLLGLQRTYEKEIKTRQGPGGSVLKYVEGSYIKRALNLATMFDWDFEVIETREDQIEGKVHFSVLGKLTIRTREGQTISKTQWGSQVLKAKQEVGDALKGATTDALKKCAAELGIAQDVYSGDV